MGIVSHQAQRHSKEMVDEAKHFVSRITPLLASPNCDQRYIINMDHTPVFFSMVPNKTLNIAGERSINVRTSTGSTMRLTCAVTVSAAGDILRPFIVFKGNAMEGLLVSLEIQKSLAFRWIVHICVKIELGWMKP